MGIFNWLRRSSLDAEFHEVSVEELGQLASEVQIRKLAFAVCANMTANALSRAVWRTYDAGKECRGDDFYTLNVQPNPNQSASVFWRSVVLALMQRNEALIILRKTAGRESLWLADNFSPVDVANPFDSLCWDSIAVNGKQLSGVYADSQVLHLTLNAMRPNAALNALADAQNRLFTTLQKDLRWRLGKHYKVHIARMAQGDEEFSKHFQQMIANLMKPFFSADNAVLPEFEGYEYTDLGDGQKTANKVSDAGRELRKMADDIFDFTAKAFLIPPVLVSGEVADSKDALQRWLTVAIDPLAEMISNEINRKSYAERAYLNGRYVKVDTSALQHFDIFANADHIAKLVGSGWSYNDIQRAIGGTEIDAEWANEHFFTKNNAGMSALKGGEQI